MKFLQIKKKTLTELINDSAFFILLVAEYIFKHTVIGQLSLLFFAATVCLLIYEKKRIPFSYFFVFNLAFILLNYFNAINGNSIQLETSLKMISTLIINLFFMFFLFTYLVLRNDIEKSLKIFTNSCILASFILVLISIDGLFTTRLGGSYTLIGMDLEINPNRIAILFGCSSIICIYNYLMKKQARNIVKAIWFIIVILLTGSRTGLFIIIMGSIVLKYMLFPNKRIRNILLGSLFAMLVYFVIMYIPILYEIIGSRVEAICEFILTGATPEEASLKSRLEYIQLAWEYFKLKPWIGYGIDCFRNIDGAYNTYSHNNYVELLFSGGIPALVLYYYPLLVITKGNLRLASKTAKGALFFAIVLTAIIIDYGVISYYERTSLTIVVFCLANLGSKRKRLLYEKNVN